MNVRISESLMTFSFREKVFGALEACTLVGTFLAAIFYPQLIMVVALAAAGFIVVLLAVWDDRLRSHSSGSSIPEHEKSSAIVSPNPARRPLPRPTGHRP